MQWVVERNACIATNVVEAAEATAPVIQVKGRDLVLQVATGKHVKLAVGLDEFNVDELPAMMEALKATIEGGLVVEINALRAELAELKGTMLVEVAANTAALLNNTAAIAATGKKVGINEEIIETNAESAQAAINLKADASAVTTLDTAVKENAKAVAEQKDIVDKINTKVFPPCKSDIKYGAHLFVHDHDQCLLSNATTLRPWFCLKSFFFFFPSSPPPSSSISLTRTLYRFRPNSLIHVMQVGSIHVRNRNQIARRVRHQVGGKTWTRCV